MVNKRRQHSPEFKFRVALEAAKGLKTTAQLAQEYNIHPNQISNWKRDLLEHGTELFVRGNGQKEQEQTQRENELYEQIGRLKMELEWLKKSCPVRLRPNAV